MKSTPHVVDELSAYLDGESRDPERIARHLQSCPECARYHAQLVRLSGHLQTLRGPEVHPAFATRVMAHAAEAPAPRFWIPRFSPRLVTALCIAGLVVVGTWRWMPEPRSPIAPPTPGKSSLRINVAWQDDAQVVEALSRLMEAGVPVDLFGDPDEAADSDTTSVPLDTILDSLADGALDGDVVDPFAQEDLTGLMDSLAEEDVQLLNDLIETHGNEV